METRPSKEQLQKAKAAFDQSSRDLKIVEYGNGVHKVEFAVTLPEEAKTSLEKMLEILKKIRKVCKEICEKKAARLTG